MAAAGKKASRYLPRQEAATLLAGLLDCSAHAALMLLREARIAGTVATRPLDWSELSNPFSLSYHESDVRRLAARELAKLPASLRPALAKAKRQPKAKPRAKAVLPKARSHKRGAHTIDDDDACYWYHELLQHGYRPTETRLAVAEHMQGSRDPSSKAKRLERKYPNWSKRVRAKRKGV